MKTVIFTITLLASIAASAVQKMTPEERDLLIQQKIGGFIEIEAKGTILVINCQRLVSLESIDDTISLARKNLQAKVLKNSQERKLKLQCFHILLMEVQNLN